jgi:hypothetical protein
MDRALVENMGAELMRTKACKAVRELIDEIGATKPDSGMPGLVRSQSVADALKVLTLLHSRLNKLEV